MKGATAILYPFAVLYDAATTVRNRLYDLSLRPSASFDIPVVSVGNLNVGGTGKTPMIEHLIRLLGNRYKIATLSRGYKRKTNGFRIAGPNDSAMTVGDEPFQFYTKFGSQVTVAVGEERALAITNILQEAPDTNVVLMDDAFQHRRVKPGFQILLTVYDNLFFNDWLLPVGRLRESKAGAKRADVVVVTKCPESLLEDEMMAIEKKIQRYVKVPVFFTTIRYGSPTPMEKSAGEIKRDVILVSGLANADHLKKHISTTYKLIHHFEFNDHHNYSENELQAIVKMAKEKNAHIITSEKDAVKLKGQQFYEILKPISWFALPIETGFVKSGKDFDEMVLNAVANA